MRCWPWPGSCRWAKVSSVQFPSENRAAPCDLSRARQKTSKEPAHAKHRVNAFILRHGPYHPEKSRWTHQHLAWLRRQRFGHRVAHLTLEADLELVGQLKELLKRLETQGIEQIRCNT